MCAAQWSSAQRALELTPGGPCGPTAQWGNVGSTNPSQNNAAALLQALPCAVEAVLLPVLESEQM